MGARNTAEQYGVATVWLHIAAAAYHVLIRRDGVLPRTLGKAA